mgnify:CR=1 FL=1
MIVIWTHNVYESHVDLLRLSYHFVLQQHQFYFQVWLNYAPLCKPAHYYMNLPLCVFCLFERQVVLYLKKTFTYVSAFLVTFQRCYSYWHTSLNTILISRTCTLCVWTTGSHIFRISENGQYSQFNKRSEEHQGTVVAKQTSGLHEERYRIKQGSLQGEILW